MDVNSRWLGVPNAISTSLCAGRAKTRPSNGGSGFFGLDASLALSQPCSDLSTDGQRVVPDGANPV